MLLSEDDAPASTPRTPQFFGPEKNDRLEA